MIRLGIRNTLATSTVLLVLAVLASTCSSTKPVPAPPPAPEFWGDIKPVVSVKELMRFMIDPLADNIFDAVKIVTTKTGSVETSPKTDEDWEKIQIGAVTMAEGASLLKIPRPFAPPGDQNNSAGPDAPELSPAQIKAKLEADPVEWNARIEALRNVGLEVLDIVKKKDVKELWDASDNLDEACESCHKSFWYPGEDAKFYQKLNHRLREFEQQSSGSDKAARPPK
jgi:cytochrome c556